MDNDPNGQRWHHGDGDEAMPVESLVTGLAEDSVPGGDFDTFMAMMQADLANLLAIVDDWHAACADDEDDARADSARHFLRALGIIANTRVANREQRRSVS